MNEILLGLSIITTSIGVIYGQWYEIIDRASEGYGYGGHPTPIEALRRIRNEFCYPLAGIIFLTLLALAPWVLQIFYSWFKYIVREPLSQWSLQNYNASAGISIVICSFLFWLLFHILSKIRSTNYQIQIEANKNQK